MARIGSWILAILLGAAFLLAGISKLTGAATPMFAGWGYPAWFAVLIGILEVAGAFGLLFPRTTRPAVLGLGVIMVGALGTHLVNGEPLESIRPVIFGALLGLLWWLRTPRAIPAASA